MRGTKEWSSLFTVLATELFGGQSQELLQFIGMGEGMEAHVASVPEETKKIAITTEAFILSSRRFLTGL